MEIALYILSVVIVVVLIGYGYIYIMRDILDYKDAKKDIFAFVESYKKRCTGNNRFLVTVESLQDSFREYDTKTINKVWLDLIKERVIEQDPQDDEWCIRRKT